ncbi:hypothetical protein SAMN05216294_3077 [Flagellimonas zhangzhouensis]|uniref:Uncharacterized protein n=1 Tax=Flagellimonas zhangzhouensis TaxID=1073328 RepID=A0A1H2Y6T6_9FLAO|nr:hypothetical protein SAMN05216294_3077 [Allomuricauda zhangzhouensis]SDX00857.1 hypothetical protein SAMN04487892_2944 [Allomuricauda zhangzhouensis]
MSIYWKILLVILVWISVSAWNKYVVKRVVAKVVKMNPNSDWLSRKHVVIKNLFQGFFWVFCVLFTIAMVFSK